MTKEERQALILELLMQHDSILVTDLATHLNVSSVTIRKDLTDLEREKKLYRNHGKAILIDPYIDNRNVSEKEKLYVEEKRLIGMKAANLIAPKDSILIASGTTMHALARSIAPADELTVITASMEVSNILASEKNICIIQLGGILRHSSLSVVGKYAENILADFSCSKLFIGVDGIDLDFGITIRSMWMRGGRLAWQAGAGIVHDSVPELEWKEVNNKTAIMKLALQSEDGNYVSLNR